jgi:endonuclease-3
MPVDTHVLRVSKRLGLIPHNADAKKAHQLLQAAVPARLIYPLHLSLIQHGRRICRARSPMCDRCRLSAECLAYPILRAESP